MRYVHHETLNKLNRADDFLYCFTDKMQLSDIHISKQVNTNPPNLDMPAFLADENLKDVFCIVFVVCQ